MRDIRFALRQSKTDPLADNEVRVWVETPDGAFTYRKMLRSQLAQLVPAVVTELSQAEVAAAAELDEQINILAAKKASLLRNNP